MKNIKFKFNLNIILLSLLFGLLIVLADCFIDAYFFKERTFLEQLFAPNLFEIYVRGLIFIIILVFGFIVSKIIYRLELSENNKSIIIKDLQAAKEEIKVLHGILPICSVCKKIRDDKGDWNQIESYISKYSEAKFSHGLCPECGIEIYPDYYQDKRID